MKIKSDIQIIEAIKRGDDGPVFHYLYDQVYKKVLAFIRKNGGLTEDAEDAFQDGVLVFMDQVLRGSYTNKTEIDAYVFVVAKNSWLGKLRKDKHQDPLTESEWQLSDDIDHSAHLINSEKEDLILSVFETIGEACKKLLMMTIYENLSLQEIAKKLGYANTNTVKTKNYKCKQRLGKEVKKNKELKELLLEL